MDTVYGVHTTEDFLVANIWRQKTRSFGPGPRVKEGKAFHPGEKVAWRKSGERTWTWRRRSRRKKLDEQKRKLQKELLEIETLSCLSKECQESLKSNLQQQLQVTLEAFLTLFRQTRECFNFQQLLLQLPFLLI